MMVHPYKEIQDVVDTIEKLEDDNTIPDWEYKLRKIFHYDHWLKGGDNNTDSFRLSGCELMRMLEETKDLIKEIKKGRQ